MLVVIITKESLDEFSTFIILAFDDNIGIIRLVVKHTNCVIRFMCTERSFLFSESDTEMGFITTLNDIFEEIVFDVLLVLNILKNEIFVKIVGNKHKFLVGTIRGEGKKRILKIG